MRVLVALLAVLLCLFGSGHARIVPVGANDAITAVNNQVTAVLANKAAPTVNAATAKAAEVAVTAAATKDATPEVHHVVRRLAPGKKNGCCMVHGVHFSFSITILLSTSSPNTIPDESAHAATDDATDDGAQYARADDD